MLPGSVPGIETPLRPQGSTALQEEALVAAGNCGDCLFFELFNRACSRAEDTVS